MTRIRKHRQGLALPLVLVFAAAMALLAGAALRSSALEARTAGYRWEALRARNLAEAAMELLLHRASERWSTGGEHCAADRYCAADFPEVAAVLARAPATWTVEAELRDAFLQPRARETLASVSSARLPAPRVLEAVVTIEGPAPVALAAGLALPRSSRNPP